MPRVAILIPASPTPAFFSQIAAGRLALSRLRWTSWEATLHVYLGGDADPGSLRDWLPHLPDVELTWAPEASVAREGDWAQSDALFRLAPRGADVLLHMDADTLPVSSFEAVLDEVVETRSVAGVIAHYPFPRFPGTAGRESWMQLLDGLIDEPLDFSFSHTLVNPDAPEDQRLTPFYVNFGAVFFPGPVFDDVAQRYLSIRPQLMDRMFENDFAGQVALALATTEAGVRTCALPMRFNFPNDPVAEAMYPDELAKAVIYHYLRTPAFDRQAIFTSPDRYREFLDLPLSGVNRRFQKAVEELVGAEFPFSGS